MKKDLVIIGAGPIGLALACSLAKTSLKVAVIEKRAQKSLASPQPDGRDIALTRYSKKILNDLGVLNQIPTSVISPIKEARVLNGDSPSSLHFDAYDAQQEALGYLVPNYLIREALYKVFQDTPNTELIPEMSVASVEACQKNASVTCSDGRCIDTALIVASDGRFSKIRNQAGISAAMEDFGHSAIVCKMTHEKPHNNVAYECFQYGRTLAVLPLTGNQASIIITMPTDQSDVTCKMEEKAFNYDIQHRFSNRLGKMWLVGKRHTYPLVSVYANQFVKSRLALLGDAAVGMHPVTAHGFNFGLRGQDTLAKLIQSSIAQGGDIGSLSMLKKYQTKHRRATRPLYLGTNAIVKLFTNDAAIPKLVRQVVLRCCDQVGPAKRAIMRQLAKID